MLDLNVLRVESRHLVSEIFGLVRVPMMTKVRVPMMTSFVAVWQHRHCACHLKGRHHLLAAVVQVSVPPPGTLNGIAA
eukprot:220614-Amphidinium_carterae.1